MISNTRKRFNDNFTQEKYEQFKRFVDEAYNHTPKFRLAETPVFIPNELKSRLLEACEQIADVICQPNFKDLTKAAIKNAALEVPKEDDHTQFLQMDFGICLDENGEPTPQLIEAQGFPSLYFFQLLLEDAYRKAYEIPENYTTHLNGISKEEYIELLRKVIVGKSRPENVVILEVEPEKQATRIDFLVTEDYLGIPTICLTKVIREEEKLYYKNEAGEKIRIEKIYNRVIFDELQQRPDLNIEFDLTQPVDVEWIGHPNWFFRISKYTMPLISSKYVPECHYLEKIAPNYPKDLDGYVLKPLYSFAGSGVKLHVTKEELDAIQDKENYILQKKVKYEPLITSPNEPVKFEIRMLMIWEKEAKRPKVINNLVRLSKGEMIGVRFNKDKDWVGASVGFFES